MNTIRRLKEGILGLVAILVGISSSGFAAPALKLEASLDQAVHEYCAAKVRAAIQNNGTDVVTLEERPVARLLRVELRDEGTHVIVYDGPVAYSYKSEPEGYSPPVVLRPNQAYSFDDMLLACSHAQDSKDDRLLFSRKGKYALRFSYPISYHNDEGKAAYELKSNWCTVSVVPPEATDAEALASIAALPNPCWLFEPDAVAFEASGDEQQGLADKLETFVKKYPTSYWTPYAHLSLAEHYERRGILPRGKRDRAMLTQAQRHLDVLATVVGFPLAKHVQSLKSSIVQGSSE